MDQKSPSLFVETVHLRRVPEAIARAREVLGDREREVVEWRFGLAGRAPQILEEIS